QRRERLVHERGTVTHRLAEVPAGLHVDVVVPTEVALRERGGQGVDGDHRGPRLGQPAGEQATLAPEVAAVAVPQPGVLTGQVEGRGDLRAGEHLEGRLPERVAAPAAVTVQAPAEAVELPQQSPPILQPFPVEAT